MGYLIVVNTVTLVISYVESGKLWILEMENVHNFLHIVTSSK